ncbi:transmembrane protein 181 [Anthonomus grandis grandis]|uniref:transmembrane protein 181 n=1 Tax=Anthonomus grandis grandis TaxID=2921223 RepID=UPI00216536CA|nr:transmembrane protein 181 [Anthonomus grandis grandis]XP_050303961.1 transmembrane protein 181 [Anthonomus grandis grandis]
MMPPADTTNLGYAYQLPSGGLSVKIRNVLSQFSDIFSEFDKYIAPAYHHDRCERSVQMRLYSMHKREFVLIFVLFFVCLGFTIFIGLAGPPITQTTSIDGISLLPKLNNSNMVSRKDIATGPFIMKTPKLSTYNQQMWLIAKLKTENTGETIDKEFDICLTISGLTEEHKPATILTDRDHKNRSRHLHCDKQLCDEFIVMHLGYLDYTHYIINVIFYDLEAFHSRYNIKELTFYFKTYNPDFTQIEVWFRLIFLVGAFSITWWYYHTLKKYPVHCWAFEQKWVGVLLPLLMTFNNPIFPMIFLVSSWLPGMLDAIFQATFLAVLFLFWLSIYHGLRQNERYFHTFYFPKFFIVSMMYFPTLILSTWQKISELRDPGYDHTTEANFYVVKAFFYIFGVVYLIYLGYLILKAYSELRSMPFFGVRLKFLTLLMIVVLTIGGIITASKFGVDVLEDNFVAQLGTHYTNSSQFMSFYGLLNIYVYTMAYVYSPSNKNGHDLGITKDNPAFSMINDSDEDVIYGSDEESRRPLNRGHNDDDSD